MNSEKFRIVVIEDEKDSREQLIARLNEEPNFKVVGSAASVSTALLAIDEHHPDAIFLDIQIKGGDAYNLIDQLLAQQIPIPAIILNTGFTQIEYAQKALNHYKAYILEIWLKPFYELWEENITKVEYLIKKYKSSTQATSPTPSKIMIKSEGDIILLSVFEIIYIEASGETAKQRKSEIFIGKNQSYKVNKNLKQLDEELSVKGFLQINRNQIINTSHISKYNINEQILLIDYNNLSFAVGTSYVPRLKQHFDSIT